MGPGEVERVSARLLEASVRPHLWAEALDGVSALFAARGAMIVHYPADGCAFPSSASLDESVDEFVRGGWHQEDPRFGRAVARGLQGAFMCDDMLFTDGERRKDLFYNDFLRKNDLAWFMGGLLTQGLMVAISLQRRAGAERFQAADIELMERMRPVFDKVGGLSRLFRENRIGGELDGLDRVGLPAFALDAACRPLSRNAAADALIGPVFRLAAGRLMAASGPDPVAGVVGRVAAGEAAPDAALKVGDGRAFRLQAYPLVGSATDIFSFARVLLLVRPLGRRTLPEDVLRALYRFTPAEARVVLRLAVGESPQEIADAAGVSVHTVRNQIRAAMEKAGVRRAIDLAALASGAAEI